MNKQHSAALLRLAVFGTIFGISACIGAAPPVFTDDFSTPALLAEKWKLVWPDAWKVAEGRLESVGGRTCSATPLIAAIQGPIEIRCRVKVLDFGPKGGWAGVTVRGIHFTLQPQGFWHVYRIAGQQRSLGGLKTAQPPVPGRWYDFQIVQRADLYQWLVDGELVAQFREPNEVLGAGEPMALATSGPRVAYDNVFLEVLADSGPASPNFVRNASFERVIDHVPVYWKPWVSTASPERFWPRWCLESDGAWHGRQALKVVSGAQENAGFFSHDNGMAIGRPCTFSIYLKSDKPALKARLAFWEFLGKWSHKAIRVGAEWERYTFTLDSPGNNRVRVGVQLQEAGALWADAAQLEPGTRATPFALSLLDSTAEPQPMNTAVAKPDPKELHGQSGPTADGVRRCLTVDGQPFFVFAPLVSLGPADTPEQIDLTVNHHADNGFRSLAVVGKIAEKWSPGAWARLFERCAARNVKVVAWPGGFNKLPREQYADFVSRWKQHPSLIAWLPVDEPELYATPEETADFVAFFKRLDPQHPVYVNNTNMGIPSRFAGLPGDILSIDDYITNREGRTVGEIVRQVEIMEEATRPTRRPVWIFISGNNLHNHYREPTPGEQVSQSFGCALAGASGLLYFLANPAGKEHWSTLRQLNRELLTLAPVLFSAESAPQATCSAAAVRFVVRRVGSQVYLVAVNQENRPTTAKFLISGLDQADAVVVFEDRTVTAKSGAIDDEFGPHARHVYRLDMTPR